MEKDRLKGWISENYNIAIGEDGYYYQLLEAVCAYVYRFNTGKEQCIQQGYLLEEEILEDAHLIALEVLFGKKAIDGGRDKSIDYTRFAEDYSEYLTWIREVQLDDKLNESTELLEWFDDGIILDAPGSDNPERAQNFFLKGRAQDFFKHLVRGECIPSESEIFYFHMFSVYLLPEDVVEGTSLEEIKIQLGKYRKKNEDNLVMPNALTWVVKVASEICQLGRFKGTYIGLVNFLDNFRFKEDCLKACWIEIMKEEFSTMEGGLSEPVYADFHEVFIRWIETRGIKIMGEPQESGAASLSSSNVLALVRSKLGKKNKSVIGNRNFTFVVPEEFLNTEESILQYDRAQKYNYFWSGICSLIDETESNMLSLVEFRCVIGYIMRRLEELDSPDMLDWQLFMNEIEATIDSANSTIAHTEDMVEGIISAYTELIGKRDIGEVLLQAVFDKINDL